MQPSFLAHPLFLIQWLKLGWRYNLQVSPVPSPRAPHVPLSGWLKLGWENIIEVYLAVSPCIPFSPDMLPGAKVRHHLQGFSLPLVQDHLCPSHPGGSKISDFLPGLTLPISPGIPSAPHMLDGPGIKKRASGFLHHLRTCLSHSKQHTCEL